MDITRQLAVRDKLITLFYEVGALGELPAPRIEKVEEEMITQEVLKVLDSLEEELRFGETRLFSGEGYHELLSNKINELRSRYSQKNNETQPVNQRDNDTTT